MHGYDPEHRSIDHIIQHDIRNTFFTEQSQRHRQADENSVGNKKDSTEHADPVTPHLQQPCCRMADKIAQCHGNDRYRQTAAHLDQLIVAEIDRQIDDHIGRQADLGHQLGHSRAEAFRKPALTGQIKTGSYHNNDSQNPLQCM